MNPTSLSSLRPHRRDFLRVGGLGLCGVTMLDVLRAQAAPMKAAKAKPIWV